MQVDSLATPTKPSPLTKYKPNNYVINTTIQPNYKQVLPNRYYISKPNHNTI